MDKEPGLLGLCASEVPPLLGWLEHFKVSAYFLDGIEVGSSQGFTIREW